MSDTEIGQAADQLKALREELGNIATFVNTFKHTEIVVELPETDGRGSIPLDVDPSYSVERVKAKLLKLTFIPVVRQKLVYNNMEMNNSFNLSEYGIQEGSKITLSVIQTT